MSDDPVPRRQRLDMTPAERREEADPSERQRPLPWYMIMLIGATATWSVTYIVSANVDVASDLGDSRTTSALMPAATTSGGGAQSLAPDGAAIYAARCAACHQASGTGLPGVFPPLAGSEWVLGDDRILVQIPLHGIAGRLSVRNATYEGVMPSFASLGDAELAAVLTHLRSQWGNAAKPVTPETVRIGRAATALRSTPWSNADEIRQGAAR